MTRRGYVLIYCIYICMYTHVTLYMYVHSCHFNKDISIEKIYEADICYYETTQHTMSHM